MRIRTVTRESTITVDEGRRDLDTLELALKQLREVGEVPGHARITIAGAGPGRWIINAKWEAEVTGREAELADEVAAGKRTINSARAELGYPPASPAAREAGIQHDGDPG